MDASSLINLINGGVLELILGLEDVTFVVGPIVLEECGSHARQLRQLAAEARITLADDTVPADQFLELLDRHRLGNGETECLALALSAPGSVVCCDDSAARTVIANEMGAESLSGSLGLLREAVQQQLLSSQQAMAVYEQMRSKGGFLPTVEETFFSNPPP